MIRNSPTDVGLLLLRLGFAALLVWLHGWHRLVQAFGYLFLGEPWTFVGFVGSLGFPYPVVFAVCSALAESVGALLVGLGLATRIGAAAVAINMSVAVFNEARGGDPIELPALYLLIAVTLLITGPGAFALRLRPRSARR
jgi:putative oxidoreductase